MYVCICLFLCVYTNDTVATCVVLFVQMPGAGAPPVSMFTCVGVCALCIHTPVCMNIEPTPSPASPACLCRVFEARKLPIKWESFQIGTEAASKNPDGSLISEEALNSVRKNKLALKGPLATPVGKVGRGM